MKIRTDFVTNSSSSSFVVSFYFELSDGKNIFFRTEGVDDSEVGEIYVRVSPRELGTAKNIQEMIDILKQGVENGYYDETGKFFEYYGVGFINELKCISSMDDIESITISGNEINYITTYRSFSYNRKTGEYTFSGSMSDSSEDYFRELSVIDDYTFEKDGSSGGDLQFSDLYRITDEYLELNDVEKKIVDTYMKSKYNSIWFNNNWFLFEDFKHCLVCLQKLNEGVDVSGTQYEGRTDRIEYVHTGDVVALKRELDNKYDNNAIDVRNSTGSLGHINSDMSSFIAPLLDSGLYNYKATVSSVTPLSKRSKRCKNALLSVCIRFDAKKDA